MSADNMRDLPRDAVGFAGAVQYQGHSIVFPLARVRHRTRSVAQVSHVGPGRMIKPDPIVASVSRLHCESLSRMRILQKKHPRRSRWMEPQGCRNELDKKPAASAKERLLDAGTVGGTTPSAVVPAKAGPIPRDRSRAFGASTGKEEIATSLRQTSPCGYGSWLSPGRRWGGLSLQQLTPP
ncbi:blr8167 [Bradyrhizobium diazoefficiens USDA 110]|uniref:Blr8167 protein n=1 Tax=Bradyrhizobium diazoefficiens (strain JCM 10833 / BCRC 13528 / IAM 13628 / NBRC 14792 / USDA 110) TaxID=224911 RepID=Q89BI5_BRADU|nr:hypothetical protein CO678_38325 [Bradyrhizobium diazoefficiens]QBP26892.1 hypothetical protein Bdiaspc4_43245 [Bradyrhizobium diazoefficiens]BAC53432.1 blr8167 [Bradyrhizobium diazoefficiens USDA 110]